MHRHYYLQSSLSSLSIFLLSQQINLNFHLLWSWLSIINTNTSIFCHYYLQSISSILIINNNKTNHYYHHDISTFTIIIIIISFDSLPHSERLHLLYPVSVEYVRYQGDHSNSPSWEQSIHTIIIIKKWDMIHLE